MKPFWLGCFSIVLGGTLELDRSTHRYLASATLSQLQRCLWSMGLSTFRLQIILCGSGEQTSTLVLAEPSENSYPSISVVQAAPDFMDVKPHPRIEWRCRDMLARDIQTQVDTKRRICSSHHVQRKPMPSLSSSYTLCKVAQYPNSLKFRVR